MQLNQQIIDVLTTLGATETEMASITAFYADQLIAAQAAVDQLEANITSLQTQLAEAQERAGTITAAIGKFVVAES
ncbi:hypothetical protein [Mesorhizobium sp. B2-1-3A]|uniref:hypothetical protein n=1 Tax=Mesorhizobium sp. B2-1-3A TaxID=2589971 RepID=UPI001126E5B6|nr:hypothetical protein [Mesorhizobium sp. B2-1-3A]TPM92738.1 hypothetical protein FJ977_28060 [Mesorhizobium sp. B2-1-3A]